MALQDPPLTSEWAENESEVYVSVADLSVSLKVYSFDQVFSQGSCKFLFP